MTAPLTPRELKAVLAGLGRPLKKALGQHFLADRNLRDAIVADLGLRPGDVVLEVGTGLGCLTEGLLAAGARVLSVDIDGQLQAFANRWLEPISEPGQLQLIEADALEGNQLNPALVEAFNTFTATALPTVRLWLVANLPYQVASTVVVAVLESHFPKGHPRAGRGLDEVSVLVQSEVADRFAAGPADGKTYGQLSLICAAHGAFTKGRHLAPTVFFPRPTVQSSIARGRLRDAPPEASEYALFKRVIKSAFQHRRKRLAKALRIGTDAFPETEIRTAMGAVGIPAEARVDELPFADYWGLAQALGGD